MSSTQHPDWLDQVQKFETNDQALAVSRREEVTHDPVVVGASLSVIADGLEAEEGAQPADQKVAGIPGVHQLGIGGKVVVHGARFAMTKRDEAPGTPSGDTQVTLLAAARSALYGIAKTFDDDELRVRALEAYEATLMNEPMTAVACPDTLDKVVIGGKVYVRAGGFKQLADGRNLPVFIAEGHPDALERGESAGSYDPDAAKRLRLVCTKLGLGAAVPETDAELMEAQFVVFGMLRAAIERKLLPGAAAQLEAAVLIKKWIREHEAELNFTEFARIDAALERLMMQLGVGIASTQVPPSAGDTVYRFLKRGERIQATDEYVDDDHVTWLPVGEGLFKGAEYGALMKPVRRAVAVTSNQIPQEFLAICQEELARGTLTSLPLKLKFGAARGMSIDDVHGWMKNTRKAFAAAVATAAAEQNQKTPPDAPKYLILRAVENSSTKHHPLPEEALGRKIHQVWRLLDEAAFLRVGQPSHHGNAFLDDLSHDWAMTRDGKHIRYFAHSSEKGDVVDIILEFEA